MVKKWVILTLLMCNTVCTIFSWNPSHWLKTKKEQQIVTIFNDISAFVTVFPEETRELQESIYYNVEVNGITVSSEEMKRIPIYNNSFTLCIKSKNQLSDQLENVSNKIKKFTSWFDAYYCFVCLVPKDETTISLAPLVIQGCQALKARRPMKFWYKWPNIVQIWLKEKLNIE